MDGAERIIKGGYSVAGGVCDAGWYAAVLVLEEADLRAYEAATPADYEAQVARYREWAPRTVGRPRRLVLVRQAEGRDAAPLELAAVERLDGPACPREASPAPVVAWTERQAGEWRLMLYQGPAARVVLRQGGALRAPQVAWTPEGPLLACERDGTDGGAEVLLCTAEGKFLWQTAGRNPRMAAVAGGVALLTEQCTRNEIRLRLQWIVDANVAAEAELRQGDYTFNADLAWAGAGDGVFVAAESCPAFGEGSQFGKHREIRVWRCAPGAVSPLPEFAVEPRAFMSIGPENLPPIRPALFVERGRPVLVFRQFRYHGFKTFGWDVFGSRLAEAGWQAPARLSPCLVLPDAGCGVLPLGGRYVGLFPALENDGQAGRSYNHRLEIHEFDAARALPPFEVPAEKRRPYEATASCRDIGLEPPPLSEPYPGRFLLWGDLHVHSAYSKCVGAADGSPDEKLRFLRDAMGCRVFTLTDHSNSQSSAELAWCLDRLEREAGDRGIVLYGTEPGYATGRHTNWYACDRAVFERLVAITDSHGRSRLADYRHAREELPPGSVIALQHFHGRDASEDEMLAHFEPLLEVAMEAMQGRCNALWDPRDGAPAFPTPFLNLGCKIGIVGGSDHFRGGPNHQCLTGFWVKEASAAGVWEALRNRYTFGVANAKLAMAATLAGQPAGSAVELASSAEVRIRLSVSSGRGIRRAALIRDGELLPWTAVGAKAAVVELTDPIASPGRHWYIPTVEAESAYGRESPAYGHTSPFFVRVRTAG